MRSAGRMCDCEVRPVETDLYVESKNVAVELVRLGWTSTREDVEELLREDLSAAEEEARALGFGQWAMNNEFSIPERLREKDSGSAGQ